jgi:hypothetical protein
MTYQLTSKNRKTVIGLMVVGVLSVIIGFIMANMGHGHHGLGHDVEHAAHGFGLGDRMWNAFYISAFFFFAVSLGALFFLALNYATEAAWFVLVKRQIEAVVGYLPLGMGILLLCLAASTFHLNHIFHWMDESTYMEFVKESTVGTDHPEYALESADGFIHNHHYDSIIANKRGYLNEIFFWVRAISYCTVFFLYWKGFRKRSLQEDLDAGTDLHYKNYKKSAVFLVFFAYFSSSLSWDWLMSIDTHWFSTLYGWYVFSGMWCTAMVAITLLTIYLKNKGHLPKVNDSHIHDLGKWVFASSFLWSYLWFSQFMLIWYADIPEEVIYYVSRIQDYKGIFFGMFAVNFIFPMLMLMSRDAKRNYNMLMIIGGTIFVGHFVDVFMLVTPGTAFDQWSFGLVEIGFFVTFLGLFIGAVLRTLSQAPVMPVNSPYLEESIHHSI